MYATALQHLDSFALGELRALMAQPLDHCVSIYLPIERAAPAFQQNMPRLERLLRQAEAQLLERGLPPLAAQQILAPARRMLDDRLAWDHQCAALALFATPTQLYCYQLPLALDERLVVDERPYLAPLLPLLSGDDHFFVLALSLKEARLFRSTRYEISQITIAGIPSGLAGALANYEFAKQHQWHPGIAGRGGERGAIFHGQGDHNDVQKEQILHYFQQVDHGVRAVLGAEQAPLVLAGVAYLLPIYRAATAYTHVLDQELAGSVDDLAPDELRTRAWPLVAPEWARAREAALARFHRLRNTQPGLASAYVRTIVPAAFIGRIEALFIAAGAQRWGRFEPASGELTLHADAAPHDSELVNATAAQVLLHGGAVFVVDPAQLPDQAPLAATFRYAI